MSENRELLLHITAKDFNEFHIRGSGKGGQHRNKTSTGVRLVHKASGAAAESTEFKSQHQNRSAAFRKVIETPVFKAWFRTAVAEASGQPTIAQRVEEAMDPRNIEVQILQDSKWVAVDPSVLTDA